MPTSWYQSIPNILEQIKKQNPKTILDIGVGFGKYGVLIREVLELPYQRYDKKQWLVKIDGIEAFEKYKNPMYDYIYNKIYYGDAVQIIKRLSKYDCILLIDVLEHFEKEEGKEFIKELMTHVNKSLIISTPMYPGKQLDYLGNKYEEHKSKWSILDFIDYDFSHKQVRIGSNAAELFQIFPCKNSNVSSIKIPKVQVCKSSIKKYKLSIGYILPHKLLTGGLKMLLSQMKALRMKGHKVCVIFRGNEGETVIPDWFDIEVDKEILVPLNKSYVDYINDCDIVMCGYYNQIYELKDSKIPIVYWEQGNEAVFGDYNDLSENLPYRLQIKQCYSFNFQLASVSSTINKMIKVRFNKDSYIIPNFIDTEFYHPIKHNFTNTILLVGNPQLKFKAFDVAMQTLQMVWDNGYRFNVNWVCQMKPYIEGVDFPINFIVQPTQEKLAEYYRTADVFLFTSIYEGFGMPPLEAMSSGTPVVTTKCGGIDEFIKPGYNALVSDVCDIYPLANSISYLLSNEDARELLSKRGRETALEFSTDKVINKLENYLISIANSDNP